MSETGKWRKDDPRLVYCGSTSKVKGQLSKLSSQNDQTRPLPDFRTKRRIRASNAVEVRIM